MKLTYILFNLLTITGPIVFAQTATDLENRGGRAFSNSVSFEVGKMDFTNGDAITITSIRGTNSKIGKGGTYSIEGTYTLDSQDGAVLAAFVTTKENSGTTAIDPTQQLKIGKGTGKFKLILTMHEKGFPHVSFYPVQGGDSFGGIYFGPQ